MIERYCGGVVPGHNDFQNADDTIKEAALKAAAAYEASMDETSFNKALTSVGDYISEVNKYLDEQKPWTLAKESNDERLHTVLWTIVQSIGIVSILIYPYMPESAEELWRRLGTSENLDSVNLSKAREWGFIEPGFKVTKGESLFPKYEEAK